MNQQQLHHRQVSTSAGQREWSVVIVGGGLVHVSALHYEELHRTQMARPARLHEGCASALTLVLLQKGMTLSCGLE